MKLIFKETADNDRLLKDIAINYAASNYGRIIKAKGFTAICKERGDIAFKVHRAASQLPRDAKQAKRPAKTII